MKRTLSHARRLKREVLPHEFNYKLNYRSLDLRAHPELYRVGRGEEGVLLVEPYKSEILPHWKFRTRADAVISSRAILKLFYDYGTREDFVGMDMARKFLQMGYTRARRYANHTGGRKYAPDGTILPFTNDAEKARAAAVFERAWIEAERDPVYADVKMFWREAFG